MARHCLIYGSIFLAINACALTDDSPPIQLTNTGKQPGWDNRSYGYHGDDGQKYHAGGHGAVYGPSFGACVFLGLGFVFCMIF